ncbi:MAG: hypothetical protein ACOYM3_22095 [Terrimicrobiaceae bacterium]
MLTNSRTTLFGYVEVSPKRFEFETGTPYQALDDLCKAHPKGFVKCGGGIWVKNFIAYQIGSGEKLVANNFCKGLVKHLRAYQGLPVFGEVLNHYPEISVFFDSIENEGLTKGLPSPGEERIGEERIRQEEVQEKPDDLLLIRAKGLFTSRPVRTPIRLDRSQSTAWKKNKGAVAATSEEDWLLLEEAYAQTDGPACVYRRKDLAQLLNNWNGEIMRSEDWKKKAGQAWRTSTRTVERLVPDGWEAVLREIYPDCEADLPWADLSGDVRAQILEILAEKKGGAA